MSRPLLMSNRKQVTITYSTTCNKVLSLVTISPATTGPFPLETYIWRWGDRWALTSIHL